MGFCKCWDKLDYVGFCIGGGCVVFWVGKMEESMYIVGK